MQKKIRLTKKFDFEAAHCLENYDGKCSRLHGHSYKFFVTVKGVPETDKTSPKLGMVMDFGLLKRIVNEEIIEKFDHSVIVSAESDYAFDEKIPMFSNVIRFPYQPTCENMLIFFADKIQKRLPENVELAELKLYETEDSFAQWLAEDN